MHQNDHADFEGCRDELRVCVSVCQGLVQGWWGSNGLWWWSVPRDQSPALSWAGNNWDGGDGLSPGSGAGLRTNKTDSHAAQPAHTALQSGSEPHYLKGLTIIIHCCVDLSSNSSEFPWTRQKVNYTLLLHSYLKELRLRWVKTCANPVEDYISALYLTLCTYLGSSAWGLLFLMLLTPVSAGHTVKVLLSEPHSPYLHKTPEQWWWHHHSTRHCACVLPVPALIRTG